MVSRLEQIDYVKYDTYLFVNLILVLTRKALLFALDLSLGFALLTSSLGSSANKIGYFVRTRLNRNKQIRIITLDYSIEKLKKLKKLLQNVIAICFNHNSADILKDFN